MNKTEWKKLIAEKIVILDGATGSNLQRRGMPVGVCPEEWILNHREVMIGLQKEYVEAGSDIIYAPTFSGNRIKLKEYGLEDQVEYLNRELIKISKEAAMGRAYVAGDITMTGEQLAPIGLMDFEELIDIYKEQIRIVAATGADLLVIETMMSLQETRAALIAAKEECDLPVMVTMTFEENGRTLYGTDPATAIVVLQELGADAVGVNCSTGPDKMVPIMKEMKKYAKVPMIAKPNAGLPKMENNQTVYDMGVEEFIYYGRQLIEAGAGVIGGCCGTTPEFIEALSYITKGMAPTEIKNPKKRILTSERTIQQIDLDGNFLIVGERINPTGKKKLQEELREGDLEGVVEFAREQKEDGAKILDINVGMNGINEKETMLNAIDEIGLSVSLPLCIDSSYPDVIEAALRRYPGRALINSVSLEKGKADILLPIARKYGAMFILLPLSQSGLPRNMEEKKNIIHTVLNKTLEYGLEKEDIVVDGLVATVGANPMAAKEALETIRYCKEELGLATIVGLSNISFGLPDRAFVNSTFLTMAIREGLTMAIANPSQELLVRTAFASDLLLAKEQADLRYIEISSVLDEKKENATFPVKKKLSFDGAKESSKQEVQKEISQSGVYEGVLKGNKKTIIEEVKKELDAGTSPSDIMNNMLISAINKVGELFDRQIYFLPQLIGSAETMKIAIEYLEPLLREAAKDGKKKDTIVIATVKGDIHDIGKNLVALMLKNYGYRVIDLGKDISKEEIVENAKKYNANIIALSALMTTTMMEMKNVIDYARQEGVASKIIIGGAVITQSFADEIGADGYSKDAADAVKLVQRLLA